MEQAMTLLVEIDFLYTLFYSRFWMTHHRMDYYSSRTTANLCNTKNKKIGSRQKSRITTPFILTMITSVPTKFMR
jgi:hypothetical protein